MKVSLRAKFGIVAVVAVAAAVSFHGGEGVKKAADSITTIGLPILLGLVLSAIGVLISTLGNLYNAIMAMAPGLTEREKKVYVKSVEGFDRSIEEIRDNTLLMLVFLAIGLASPMVSSMVVPDHVWVIRPDILTSSAFVDFVGKCFTTITLAVTVLSMWAIRDTAETMFTIHKYYVEITKNTISTAKPSRQIVFKVSDESERDQVDETTD